MSTSQRDTLSTSILAGLPGGTTGGYTPVQFQVFLCKAISINIYGFVYSSS